MMEKCPISHQEKIATLVHNALALQKLFVLKHIYLLAFAFPNTIYLVLVISLLITLYQSITLLVKWLPNDSLKGCYCASLQRP